MKMLSLLLSLFYLSAFAQDSNSIELIDFSDQYSGKIFLSKETDDEVDGNCQLVLYDKKTAKEILSAFAFLSEYDLENGQARTNIKQIPYGEQSVLIMEDFNFDDKEDIAIRSGFFSCYGGPAYDVYLATKNGFEFSEDFTQLASEYCGMFSVDHEKEELYTRTKSGCCWHQYSTYVFEDNRVVPIEIIEEYYNGMFVENLIQKRVNGKMQESLEKIFETEYNTPEFTILFENGKKMYLMEGMNDNLYYVFTDKDDKVELEYNEAFFYNEKAKTFSFTNNKTTYIISEKEILIKEGSKEFRLNKVNQIKGTFADLRKIDFNNVYVK